jgi:GNAT superfamily N-acetyltransferase
VAEPGPAGPGPAELGLLLACQNAADAADRPGDSPTGLAELRSLLIPPYRGQRLLFTALDPAGNAIGWARLGLYEAFHRSIGHGAVTVHPASRRRGVGSALVSAVAAAAREHGRSRLILDAPRTAATEGFARRHGLCVSGCDLRSRLDLGAPGLPERLAAARGAFPHQYQHQQPRLRRHARPSARDHADNGFMGGGFMPVRWYSVCPDHLLEDYVRALDSLHAKPGTAENAPFSAGEIRYRESSAHAAGLREYTVCLIDPASGRIAALSSAHTADGVRGEQNETVVVPEYRGRGLAAQVKARLIEELMAAEPNLRVLDAYNAMDNHRMLAVNRRLGFRPVDAHAAWTLGL